IYSFLQIVTWLSSIKGSGLRRGFRSGSLLQVSRSRTRAIFAENSRICAMSADAPQYRRPGTNACCNQVAGPSSDCASARKLHGRVEVWLLEPGRAPMTRDDSRRPLKV